MCNETLLRNFLGNLASQTGAIALFGDTGQAAAAFASANPAAPTDDPVRLSLAHFVLLVPLAAFRNWFYEAMLPMSRSGSGHVVIDGVEFSFLRRAACAQSIALQPSTPVIDPRSGSSLGQLVTGDVLARGTRSEHQFLLERMPELVRPLVPLSTIATEMDVCSLLDLPFGIASARSGKIDDVLLAAHDLGLVGESDLPVAYHFQPCAQPNVSLGVVNAVRRRMYARAMNGTDHFSHFLSLYQVLEHAFLDFHVAQLGAELAAGNSARVIALWNKRTAERSLLEGVVSRVLPSISTLARTGYPTKGHALYIGCGLNQHFEITASNYEDKISGLIYDVRCSIVHAKADQSFLEPSPPVLSALGACLIPDMRAIARALVVL